MTDLLPAEWEFEAADPEVGILTEAVTHTCDANAADDRWDSATEDVSMVNVEKDGKTVVAVITVFTCPACSATTAVTEHWPLWFFEDEPGGDS